MLPCMTSLNNACTVAMVPMCDFIHLPKSVLLSCSLVWLHSLTNACNVCHALLYDFIHLPKSVLLSCSPVWLNSLTKACTVVMPPCMTSFTYQSMYCCHTLFYDFIHIQKYALCHTHLYNLILLLRFNPQQRAVMELSLTNLLRFFLYDPASKQLVTGGWKDKHSLQWRHNWCDCVLNHQPHDRYSIVYSDADQRKHQSSASLVFVRGIHRGPVNSPHKCPVTRKMFPFDDVIMWRHMGPVSMYRYGDSHYKDKTVVRLPYLYNGIPIMVRLFISIEISTPPPPPPSVKTSQSSATQLLVQKLIWPNYEEIITAQHYCPSLWEINRWLVDSRHKGGVSMWRCYNEVGISYPLPKYTPLCFALL